MKHLYIVMFCFIVSTTSIQDIKAENVFPIFETSLKRLYIPIKDIGVYQEDLAHEVGFNFSYNINCQLFVEPSEGHIQTLAEGFSGTTDRSTPWKTLTELLAAYQNADIDAVRAFYTPDSQSEIDEFTADSEIKGRFISFMESIISMDVHLGFEYKNGFLALVNVDYGDDGDPWVDVTPIFFVKSNSGYLVSKVVLDTPMPLNIAVYLQRGFPVANLPAPKHGLTIEKTGTGDGIVRSNRDKIDCGEDCFEVYVEGTQIWLKAIPDEYSTFEGWLVNGKPLTGRLVIKEDTILTAVFNKIPPKEYTLTIVKSGTGDGIVMDSETACETADCLELFSLYADDTEAPVVASEIDCGETCSMTYTEGTTVRLKAVAAEGSELVEWQVNSEAVTGPFEITKDSIITVTFNKTALVEEESDSSGEDQL